MRKRSKSRAYALQLLYQLEITRVLDSDKKQGFWERAKEDGPKKSELMEIRSFSEELVDKVGAHKTKIDELIRAAAEHWDLERMAVVDRNILRLGVAEVLFFDDIPAKVAINEAIELAKKFGDSESPRFVNGILDKIARSEKKNKNTLS